jgi:hypothetical protein
MEADLRQGRTGEPSSFGPARGWRMYRSCSSLHLFLPLSSPSTLVTLHSSLLNLLTSYLTFLPPRFSTPSFRKHIRVKQTGPALPHVFLHPFRTPSDPRRRPHPQARRRHPCRCDQASPRHGRADERVFGPERYRSKGGAERARKGSSSLLFVSLPCFLAGDEIGQLLIGMWLDETSRLRKGWLSSVGCT